MKQYELIATNDAGESAKYTGDTLEDCKLQFSNEYSDITEYIARIYNHYSGKLIQVKPMGSLVYSKA